MSAPSNDIRVEILLHDRVRGTCLIGTTPFAGFFCVSRALASRANTLDHRAPWRCLNKATQVQHFLLLPRFIANTYVSQHENTTKVTLRQFF